MSDSPSIAATPAPALANSVAKPAASRRAGKKVARFGWFGLRALLTDDVFTGDFIPNIVGEDRRRQLLMKILQIQAIIIAILMGVMVLGAPLLQPVYRFHALNPQHQVMDLVPLNEPNLTNKAVMDWATASITAVMTFGFGDIDQQILSQRHRFTKAGWESFLEALQRQGVRDIFKEHQLVLTTVPGDSPLITGEGMDADDQYIWVVQLPIIMNYMTNNNVTSHSRAIIQLTVARVPPAENINGIAIKAWNLAN